MIILKSAIGLYRDLWEVVGCTNLGKTQWRAPIARIDLLPTHLNRYSIEMVQIQ